MPVKTHTHSELSITLKEKKKKERSKEQVEKSIQDYQHCFYFTNT